MAVNNTWRVATGVGSAAFFTSTIVWCVFYGNPQNSLHVSALSWSYTGLLGVIVSVGFGEILNVATLRSTQK